MQQVQHFVFQNTDYELQGQLQMTGGNDISLIYPWVHIASLSQEIGLWLDREEAAREAGRGKEEPSKSGRRRLSQGITMTYLHSNWAQSLYSDEMRLLYLDVYIIGSSGEQLLYYSS